MVEIEVVLKVLVDAAVACLVGCVGRITAACCLRDWCLRDVQRRVSGVAASA